jgi:MFS family permease
VKTVRSLTVVSVIGLALFCFGPSTGVAIAGAVLWGAGLALGFPVGMSAAADDEARAPARVGVVSTIGYVAFLTGPPVLGFIGDHVGARHPLLVISLQLVPAALLVPAARKPAPVDRSVSGR